MKATVSGTENDRQRDEVGGLHSVQRRAQAGEGQKRGTMPMAVPTRAMIILPRHHSQYARALGTERKEGEIWKAHSLAWPNSPIHNS
jgi:hypothetical protein